MAETVIAATAGMRSNDTVEAGPDTISNLFDTTAESRATSSTSTSIHHLPNEVLDHIFYFLDSSPPSASKLHDEPVFELTMSSTIPLKNSSLVSKRWRAAALPLLFKHACLTVMSGEQTPKPILNDEAQPLLSFLQAQNLTFWVQSFTICIFDKKVADTSSGNYAIDDFTGFWTTIFEIIDPLTITISAPAQALGSLTNCYVHAEDAWAFAVPYHILQLDRTTPPEPITRSPAKSRQGSPRGSPQYNLRGSGPRGSIPRSSKLFNIRPWTALLLNEGSFIKIYKSYEYFLKHPPSILPDLIGVELPTSYPLIPPTVRDLSYIAQFPTSPHFQLLTKHFPRLDRLYVQFVPRNRNWDDRSSMGRADTRDMWMERNSCYVSLMREMFAGGGILSGSGNFRSLKVFESGDAADEDAWKQAVEWVERSGGWRVERDGVFVREADESGDAIHVFQGELRRWAFNGVAKLPVSSLGFYFHPEVMVE